MVAMARASYTPLAVDRTVKTRAGVRRHHDRPTAYFPLEPSGDLADEAAPHAKRNLPTSAITASPASSSTRNRSQSVD